MEATITKTNVQIVQEAYAAFASGNIVDIVNNCAEDVVWGSYTNPDTPFAGNYYGKEGVMEFFSAVGEHVEYLNFEAREFISQGDNVVVLGHHTGKVKSTGKTFDHDWCMHFRLREGRILHFFAYVDSRDQSAAYKV